MEQEVSSLVCWQLLVVRERERETQRERERERERERGAAKVKSYRGTLDPDSGFYPSGELLQREKEKEKEKAKRGPCCNYLYIYTYTYICACTVHVFIILGSGSGAVTHTLLASSTYYCNLTSTLSSLVEEEREED